MNDYPVLIQKYQQRKQRRRRFTRIEKLEDERKYCWKKRDETLHSNNLTLDTLKDYNTVKANLLDEGVDIGETKPFVTMIKNAKELHFDPKHILNRLKTLVDYR